MVVHEVGVGARFEQNCNAVSASTVSKYGAKERRISETVTTFQKCSKFQQKFGHFGIVILGGKMQRGPTFAVCKRGSNATQ